MEMAVVLSRRATMAMRLCQPVSLPRILPYLCSSRHVPALASPPSRATSSSSFFTSLWCSARSTRKIRCSSQATTNKDADLHVPVLLEESLDSNAQLEALLKQLEHDGPLALRLALAGKDDLPSAKSVELSVVICNDDYICKLNKEWLGKNTPTDVLSFPQNQPPGISSTLLLGDVIISVDTAKRQAEERGHNLLDECRILLVHGLLHVLGYDHEEGPKAEAEMENEESHILQHLGWLSKGLINASSNGRLGETQLSSVKKESKDDLPQSRVVPQSRPPFRVLLCDMDGTLLNSKSKITNKTATALKEAIARGVKVIIATGKTRAAVMTACRPVGLEGETGVVSDTLPGVFLQGLLVYGQHGNIVHKQILNPDICRKAFQYSLEHKQPLVGFCDDRLVTLFDHPIIGGLHTIYMEPKAEVLPSLQYLMNNCQMQKLLFADTAERIKGLIRPYWFEETKDHARVVQAQADMLEIIPMGASKGKGVTLLLDDLGVHPADVMAIGDGENDIEMLELVGWGVAMGNGAARTLAVADTQVASNDEDGVAEALERFLLT